MLTSVRLHNLLRHTKVLGPGIRAAIWFQGCRRSCKGCMSPDTRSMNAGVVMPTKRLYDEIMKINDIEGITISGGEPFLQVDALYELLCALRQTSKLGVIIYTGYTMEELRRCENDKIDRILSGLADLVIDGEYVDELNNGGSLVGSSNQQLNFITDRYLNDKELYEGNIRNVEILATKDTFFFTGIPERSMLETWVKMKKDFER